MYESEANSTSITVSALRWRQNTCFFNGNTTATNLLKEKILADKQHLRSHEGWVGGGGGGGGRYDTDPILVGTCRGILENILEVFLKLFELFFEWVAWER